MTKLPELILCGYERGGTTLLSELFRVNGYCSGFECGILMCRKPVHFPSYQPYSDMLAPGWGLDSLSLDSICSRSFEYFYSQLIAKAFPVQNDCKFFDKTPIYMKSLGSCMSRTKFIDKACVIHRDPRSVLVSWSKRQKGKQSVEEYILQNIDHYCQRYLSYFIGSIAHANNPNVLFVAFEDLVGQEESCANIIGLFARNKPFKTIKTNPSFNNVIGGGMKSSKLNEYKNFLSQDTEEKILDKTKLASIFFSKDVTNKAYMQYWVDVHLNITSILENFDIKNISYRVRGEYFEPFTYLLANKDVLEAKINPIDHFREYGFFEGRCGSGVG